MSNGSAPSHILYLCSNRWNSAITEYCLNSAAAMLQRGWEVSLICKQGSPLAKRAAELPLANLVTTQDFGLASFPWFRRETKRLNPDQVLCFGGPESFLCTLKWAWARKKPLLLRFRGQALPIASAWQRARMSLMDRFFDLIVVPSLAMQKTYTQWLGRPIVRFLPLATNTGKFKFCQTEQSTTTPKRPRVLVVARFDPVKGFQELMKLMGQIKRDWPIDRPLPHLEIIGRAENLSADQIQQWAAEQQLILGSDYDLTTAFVSDLPQLMSEASCGLILSQDSEIICRVAQEFLCCGCPIVVSGVGSLEECLLETSFGISLKQMADREKPQVVNDYLWTSFSESLEQRKKRADSAQQYFSYQKHSRDLEILLTELRSTP